MSPPSRSWPLRARHVATMWLFHEEYARQACGVVEFYRRLSQHDKNNVDRMIGEIVAAATKRAAREAGRKEG